jgi:hypothetical protein
MDLDESDFGTTLQRLAHAEMALKTAISACIIQVGLLFSVLRFPPETTALAETRFSKTAEQFIPDREQFEGGRT